MASKTPELICKFLVLLYDGGEEPTAFSAVDFNGIAKTLIGRLPEVISADYFEPDSNRKSESFFIHGFNDGVLASKRTEGFLEQFKDRSSRKPTINLPIPEPIRTQFLDEIYDEIKTYFDKINDHDLQNKGSEFAKSVRIFKNPYFWILAKRGRPQQSSQDEEASLPRTGTLQPTALIFCGPPGTGKTRASLILCRKILDGIYVKSPSELQLEKFPSSKKLIEHPNFYRVQFHPSFSYEEFVEGLRPEPINVNGKSDVTYLVRPGVLRVVAQLARAYQNPGETGITFYCEFADKSWRLSTNSDVSIYRLMRRNGHFKYRGNVVARSGADDTTTVPDTSNPTQDGIYELIWYAEENDPLDFVLFIDEFNRGNPARIFGETLSLLEESKRFPGEEAASITLPYSRKELFLPTNLHLVCAMNLADRSLSHLDQALRRRFKFVYLKPQMDLLRPNEYSTLTGRLDTDPTVHDAVVTHFELINSALSKCGVNTDNQIGHSYGFKLLGEFYSQATSTPGFPEIIVNLLNNLWSTELHSLVRDILGQGRIERFVKELESLASNTKENDQILALNSDLIKGYLLDPNPEDQSFPWHAA